MNSHFVHLEYSTVHPGVARAEQVVQNVRGIRDNFSGPRSLSTLLLAAVVAAMVVVADQLIDTWADGHLLAAWVTLWAVGFVAVGLFAGATRELASRLMTGLDASVGHRPNRCPFDGRPARRDQPQRRLDRHLGSEQPAKPSRQHHPRAPQLHLSIHRVSMPVEPSCFMLFQVLTD